MGRPGTGKSWWVRKRLEQARRPWVWTNGQLTAVSLFEVLFAHPDAVIVIDDVPLLFQDKQVRQYLMAACDSRDERRVDRRVFGDERTVRFSGSIIAISNEDLPTGPTGDALASRFDLVRHDPSDGEIAEYIRATMCPGDTETEVADWAIGRVAGSGLRLTIRHAETALRFHRDGQRRKRANDWKYLFDQTLASVSSAAPAPADDREDPRDRKAREAAESYDRWGGDVETAARECDCSRATLYRRRERWLTRRDEAPRLPR